MKSTYLLILILTLAGFNSFAQWTLYYSLPQGSSLNSEYFTDVNTGYEVGDWGTIIKTCDGGLSWKVESSGTTKNLKSVCFPDANTGYSVGGDYTTGSIILKTINGGTSWVTLQSGTNLGLSSVYFSNADTGYAVGNGAILKTIDGGANWNVTPIEGILNSVYFPDADTGYAVGDYSYIFDHICIIYKTTNGGVDWMLQTSFSSQQSLSSVYFTNADTGYVAGTYYAPTIETEGYVMKTSDGGATWSDVLNTWNIFDYPHSWLSSVFFTDTNTGYAVGSSIFKTSDGGTNWILQTGDSINALASVYFSDVDTGYAIGYQGNVLKTNDGGTNWSTNLTWTAINYHTIHFTDLNTGYAAGDRGTLLKTIDGGNSWSSLPSGTSSTLNSIDFVDYNDGYAVGDSGVLLKTSDGGTSWITLAPGTNVRLSSVIFPDNQTGYVVGDSGTILKTQNGGITWESEYSGTTTNLTSVFFIDTNTGWATGYTLGWHTQTALIYTTDGGATWNNSLQFNGTINGASMLNGIFFTDPLNGYLVGGGGNELGGFGGIYKSTDGGINWYSLDVTGYPQIINSIYFTDPTTGYAVGEDGIILSTTDAGISWNSQVSENNQNLLSVCFPEASTGYIVGNSGTILKTSNSGGTVGIKENHLTYQLKSNLNIYPDPATDKITIEPTEPGNNMSGTAIIYGMTGKEILRKEVKGSKVEVNVSFLPKGYYFIRLENIKKTEYGYFIKE